ncbi:hypothetical protein [Parahalioglobus pacificus]|uniref:Acyl-protein synthetase n=1 Tax=Parahalioglobus pacificus TaxID=930806 RepID=A0A919CL29_9GAMM|nr:hypothetical protein [Halioglobus pacificus]GHD33722.1 acyl-protein synthetase [Halioglobus pacificus]
MSSLLEVPPYTADRRDEFLRQMHELHRLHLDGCASYRRFADVTTDVSESEDLPYVHVGLFKRVLLQTDSPGLTHERVLKSSATSSGVSSEIRLDKTSSELQAASTLAIFQDFLGREPRPLLILDSPRSLRTRGEMSARIAAALSLRPLATELSFLLDDASDPGSMKWGALEEVLESSQRLMVYGFTWILWQAWAEQRFPESIRSLLLGKEVHFVHSGGWKKLENVAVSRQQFEDTLLDGLAPGSKVIDYYGLVEQVGIIYPLCEHGYRHVPAWADVLVRDPYSGESVTDRVGQLQLMNVLARGAPYHSVLTEDLGRVVSGTCECGRPGKRFELLGRVPKAEVRGCANV